MRSCGYAEVSRGEACQSAFLLLAEAIDALHSARRPIVSVGHGPTKQSQLPYSGKQRLAAPLVGYSASHDLCFFKDCFLPFSFWRPLSH